MIVTYRLKGIQIVTNLEQPTLPDMPDVPENAQNPDAPEVSEESDMLALLSKIVEGESDEDIAAITAGALIGIQAEQAQIRPAIVSLAEEIAKFVNVIVVRNTELSERINVLSARHDQMYGRLDERITGLKEAVQFVGEQQQYVTDETNRAKAELKDMASKFMSNPMKAVGAFMGGGFMGGGRKNRAAAIESNDAEETSNDHA